MENVSARRVITLTGNDRVKFLQGLITNEVPDAEGKLVYAALLTPQGKYLFDFFVLSKAGRILIDVARHSADSLLTRLTMYKLRADVTIDISDIGVSRGLGIPPNGALPDPRHQALGWRLYGNPCSFSNNIDWVKIRVAHCIPESFIELIKDETYILEAGFERLNGVDFKKGCYVGQEVTARMKHKTELKKGLAVVNIEGAAPIGTEIIAGGKPAGVLYTQFDNRAIAYLRFGRASADMNAGEAKISYSRNVQAP